MEAFMATHAARSPSRPRRSNPPKIKMALAVTGIAAAAFLLAWNAGLFNFWNAVPPAGLAARQAEAAKTPEQRSADAQARLLADAQAADNSKKQGTITAGP